MSKQLSLFPENTGNWSEKNGKVTINPVPFVNEVETFNATFGKPNNYEPTIPEKKEWQFVYDFILEELEEYREACERGDIVEILDALCDITYVSLGNGVMLHGLKDKIWPAYQEVQASLICQKLAHLKKKPWRQSANEVRSKVRPVILKKSRRDGLLSTEQEIRRS
jgi:hypothetical protein